MTVGGECTRFTAGLGLLPNKQSLLFDLLRDDLLTGGDILTGCLFVTFDVEISLLLDGGEGSFLVADNFLSSFPLEGRAGGGEMEDLVAGGGTLDSFFFLSR